MNSHIWPPLVAIFLALLVWEAFGAIQDEKYLLKTKCLNFFSLQATAVDRCEKLPIPEGREKWPPEVAIYASISNSCPKKTRTIELKNDIKKPADKTELQVKRTRTKETCFEINRPLGTFIYISLKRHRYYTYQYKVACSTFPMFAY